MAFAEACVQWWRRTVRWSNSRQSWEERLGLLALVAGFACLIWFGGKLSALVQVVLWGLVLLTGAVLLRRGWLKLFGPVLFYDMVRSARRGRYILLRCVYLALLLFVLFTTYNSMHWYGYGRTSPQQAAELAENFFESLMFVQLVAVMVLTPAYVAGAIADEKDRKTLEFLLATDLRNREIVLSKLVARLANLSLLVIAGLPLVSLLQFLGGVDPNLVLVGFAATALTMLGLAGLSILNSTLCKKPRDAIAMTYLMAVAYYVIATLALILAQMPIPRLSTSPLPGFFTYKEMLEALNVGNLGYIPALVKQAGYRGTLATDLPILLRNYAIFQGLLAAVCVSWSVLRLRAIALRQAEGTSGKRRKRLLFARPPIGNAPMLWKEAYIEGGIRFDWVAWLVVLLLVAVTFVPVGFIFWFTFLEPAWGGGPSRSEQLAEAMNGWVRTIGTLVGCLLLLGVAVRASGAISGERDRQTLDALLTSPLDSDDILLAKTLGAVLSVRTGWLWLVVVWGLGVLTGGLHILALPLLLGSWFVFATFLALLGSWFSIVSRTTLRATVWTLLATAAIGVGHWLPWMCCVPIMAMGGRGDGRIWEYLAKFQAGLTPPAVMAILQFSGHEFRHREFKEFCGFSLFGVFVWMIFTALLWVAASARFRALTNRLALNESEYDGYIPPRPRRERAPEPPIATSEPLPPAQGVVLLEEIWETPRQPRQDDDAPEDDRRVRRPS